MLTSSVIFGIAVRIFSPSLEDLVLWWTSFEGTVAQVKSAESNDLCTLRIEPTSGGRPFSDSIQSGACVSLLGTRVSKGMWSWRFRVATNHEFRKRVAVVPDLVGLGAIAAALAFLLRQIRQTLGFVRGHRGHSSSSARSREARPASSRPEVDSQD